VALRGGCWCALTPGAARSHGRGGRGGGALLNLGAAPDLTGVTTPKPSLNGTCALCEVPFRVGDQYVAVWQRKPVRTAVLLGITVHRACYGQLDLGDLGRIFRALERGLAVPLRVLRPAAALPSREG
jgi:hypothetical protein